MKKATALRKRLTSFRKKNENPTVSTRIRTKIEPSRTERSTHTTTITTTTTTTTCKSSSVTPITSSPVKPSPLANSDSDAAATRDENDHPERDVHHLPQQEQGRRPLTQQEKNDFERISKAAAALDKAGNDLFERGEYTKAMTTYTRALKLKRRTLSLGLEDQEERKDYLLASVATSINNIGYLRQRSGASSDEAMAAYRDALQIKREILGNDNLSVGKTLNNIGSVHFSTKRWDQALEAYLEAQKIMVSNLGKDHRDVATVFSNIGDVHLAKNQGKKAKNYYSEALRIRWTLFGDHDPKCVRLLEKIASIEMQGSPEEMQMTSSLKDLLGLEEDDGERPVHGELRLLRDKVGEDIQRVESMERNMALDMVRDKLKIIRDMRHLHLGEHTELAQDDAGLKVGPLTPVQRKEALLCVKDRLARLRESRSSEKPGKELGEANMTNPMIDALRCMNISRRNLAESMEQAANYHM